MADIFCVGEGASFPETEFMHDKKGTLFEPAIHTKSPFHYAETGDLIDPPAHHIATPLLVPLPLQVLSRLKTLVEKTSVEHVQRLIDDSLRKD
jgi:hypothetical protein